MCNVRKQRNLLSAASPVTRLARLASFALAFSLMKNVEKTTPVIQAIVIMNSQ